MLKGKWSFCNIKLQKMEKEWDFNLCYKCKIPYSQICKCQHTRKCVNNHQWVECPNHKGKIIVNPKLVNKVHSTDFLCNEFCVDPFTLGFPVVIKNEIK